MSQLSINQLPPNSHPCSFHNGSFDRFHDDDCPFSYFKTSEKFKFLFYSVQMWKTWTRWIQRRELILKFINRKKNLDDNYFNKMVKRIFEYTMKLIVVHIFNTKQIIIYNYCIEFLNSRFAFDHLIHRICSVEILNVDTNKISILFLSKSSEKIFFFVVRCILSDSCSFVRHEIVRVGKTKSSLEIFML